MTRPMPAAPEVRIYNVELEGEEHEGPERYIVGTAVPYGVWADVGGFTERFQRGAFARSIRSAPAIPLLAFHDSNSWPVGISEHWEETELGLRGVWRMNMKSANGRDAYENIAGGFVRYLSVGFQPSADGYKIETKTGGANPRVTHRDARLLETSVVNIPAYADAQVSEIRDLFTRSSQIATDVRPRVQEWGRVRDRLKGSQI